jgi:drug/metabolite transporter (DMT)-like permease
MWVEIAVAASVLQTTRNALARSLSERISPALNSWSRFAFNLPFSLALVGVLAVLAPLPRLSWVFYGLCLGTALSQLLGNVALVSAFRYANFAESIALHKLEVVFAALLGVVVFREEPSALGWVGIVLCSGGILLMNLGRERGPKGWRRAFHLDRGAGLALLCALLLVLASFMLKEATSVFALLNPRVGSGRFEAAAFTLFHTTWMEVLILSVYLWRWSPGEFQRVPRHWRRMALIGASGFAGSLCWFWAFSLTLVVYVKAVGQLESVFAVVLALVVWREREVVRQLPAVALLVLGIVVVLFS